MSSPWRQRRDVRRLCPGRTRARKQSFKAATVSITCSRGAVGRSNGNLRRVRELPEPGVFRQRFEFWVETSLSAVLRSEQDGRLQVFDGYRRIPQGCMSGGEGVADVLPVRSHFVGLTEGLDGLLISPGVQFEHSQAVAVFGGLSGRLWRAELVIAETKVDRRARRHLPDRTAG